MAFLHLKEVALEVLIQHQISGISGHLHVVVKPETVTLSGTMENFSEKRRLETIVKGFAGDRKVSNQIRVIPLCEQE